MPPGALFTSPEYLEPLERFGCAVPETGWTAAPIQLEHGARAPCYRKAHSWGEFVFDFEFAAAYQERGLHYYPKLVCCVPFTPVTGSRLLAASDNAKQQLAAELIARAARDGDSSAHVLFLPLEELQLLKGNGWLPRMQLRYGWSNAGYASFDDFLSRLSSKKRKNIRRERAAVASSDLVVEWCPGQALTDREWSRIATLYSSTYRVRGQLPYLNLQCLRAWAANFGASMQFCLARRQGQIVAMAFYFRDETMLYGRHWGAEASEPGLHFELCYYQGIEYCIDQRIARFDAGVQGEHRLLRGFEPELSYSAHWFAHRAFHAAIAQALEREATMLQAHMQSLREHTAFRQTG
jgi:uncharacterized protein